MRDALLGRWSVVSWYQAYDDGHVVYPFGEDPTGFIDYQDAGYMCCTIARSGRANFETGGQWNASAAEKAAAYDSYLSYSGTFDVVDDTVLHRVRFAIYPNWVGTVQKRVFDLNGDALNLSARLEDGTPEARTAVLQWIRADVEGA